MATITKGYTFGTTEVVTSAKLHSLVDSATLSFSVSDEIVFGDGLTTGNWKVAISGTSLLFYRYEGGNWVSKGGFTA
jgi:hypothetical protein